MDFHHFLDLVPDLISAPLGGLESQLKMVPKERPLFNEKELLKRLPKEASVLALFYPNSLGKTSFLLTLRASYQGVHAAQISFPGGKKEPGDKTFAETALREANEEIGVNPTDIKLLRKISNTYIPPSNFLVHSYVGILAYEPEFRLNHEVEQIIEVKLSDLLDSRTLKTKRLTTSYMNDVQVPYYDLNNHTVWGATAMILSEIKDLIKVVNS
ncbi:MAG: CoA pyrophosphatase [Lutimonas sp.]